MKSFILAIAGLLMLCATGVAQTPPPFSFDFYGDENDLIEAIVSPKPYPSFPYESKWIVSGGVVVEVDPDPGTYELLLYLRTKGLDPITSSWRFDDYPDSPFDLDHVGGYGNLPTEWTNADMNVLEKYLYGKYTVEGRVKVDGQWAGDWQALPEVTMTQDWEPILTKVTGTGHYDSWGPGEEHCDAICVEIDPDGKAFGNGEDCSAEISFLYWDAANGEYAVASTTSLFIPYADRNDTHTVTGYYTHGKIPTPGAYAEYMVAVRYKQNIDDEDLYSYYGFTWADHDNLTDLD